MDHSELVKALAKPGADIASNMTPVEAHAWHMATGISGEAGEILEVIKKHVIYQKPLNSDNLIEELGDIEFYLEGLRQGFGITREECLQNNILKLTKRYAKLHYDDADAINRVDKN